MANSTEMNNQSTRSLNLVMGSGSLYAKSSGPYLAVKGLADTLGRLGHEVTVIGTRDRWRSPQPSEYGSARAMAFGQVGPYSLHYAPGLGRWLDRAALPADIVSLYGLWLHSNHRLAKWAVGRNTPYLIAPSGNLSPVALNISRWKKKLSYHWFGRDLLARVSVFQALAPGEVDDIRSYGLKQPIVLIPNGVDVREHPEAEEKANAIRARFDSEKILLFLGRLHPIKGIDMLLTAWSALGRAKEGWRLAIAGPDNGSHKAQLEAMVRELNIGESVTFVGPQHGEDKAAWFMASDLFVLPSRSEGFAMTPLEALSFGKPLLLTTACDFPQARLAGAALEVEPTATAIRQGLQDALSMTDDQRRAMGEIGYRLVCKQFSQETIAQELTKVYHWMRGEAAAPDTLVSP